MTEILHRDLSRKTFVKGGGMMLVGFTVAGTFSRGTGAANVVPYASAGPPSNSEADSFLAIHADNTVTVKSGHVELGQGSSVGIGMIAAEELDVDLSQIKIMQTDTNVTPNTGGTWGSSTISSAGPRVRAAAAYAKQALLGMAAKELGVAASSLSVSKGVISGGGRSITYGQLVGDKLLNVKMPTQTLQTGQSPAKPVAQYRLVGTEQHRFDIPDKVTGKFTYVHNIKVPGMWHARVVRPRGQGAYPSGAPIVSVDESSIKGTGAQIVRRGDFLAVVAPNEYQAIQAASQLKVKWADPPTMSSSGNIWKQMREFDAAGKTPARIQVNTGNVDKGLASAAVRVEGSSYMYHYNGHLPIGPSTSVADVKPNGAVIFSNTQEVYGTRRTAAQLLNLPEENVRIIYYEGSSCYGPNQYNDAAWSAAIISQEIGRPVRLQLMRWDEHGWDFHGPALLADLRGGVDANGKIVAYEYTGYGQPGTSLNELSRQLTGTPVPNAGNGSAETGNTGTQYQLANRRVIGKSLPLFNNYLKTSALRAPNSVQATFASEQFVDELAYAARMDPVEFRRRNINQQDLHRWSDVLEAVAKLSKWQPRVAASNVASGTILRGRGVALGGFAGTQAGVVADIEVNTKTGKISVKKLWAAENAGLMVSPEGSHNQMVGCLVTGTSRALYEQVKFNAKRVTSLDWVSYPSIRFVDAPEVESVIVQRPDLQPTGSGEPGLVPVPAAIANAFFDATGVRIREAPMTPARVRAVLKAAGR